MKDNHGNESHDNIDLVDFEEDEKINFVSDSNINILKIIINQIYYTILRQSMN